MSDDLFADNVALRDVTFLMRMTKEERDFLHAEAKRRDIRDATSLIRYCIRECLTKTTP